MAKQNPSKQAPKAKVAPEGAPVFTVDQPAPKPDEGRKQQLTAELPQSGRRVPVTTDEDGEETPDKKWTTASRARWGFGEGSDNVAELNRESMEIDKKIAEGK